MAKKRDEDGAASVDDRDGRSGSSQAQAMTTGRNGAPGYCVRGSSLARRVDWGGFAFERAAAPWWLEPRRPAAVSFVSRLVSVA